MYRTDSIAADAAGLARAAELLRRGEVVAVPTETVYGLAADATNPAALARVFEAKERPRDNPLIVHVGRHRSSIDDLSSTGCIDATAMTDAQLATAARLVETFWPGPLSVVLPRGAGVAAEVSPGSDTVGLRMPDSPALLELLALVEVPLAAPSANRANRISPTSATAVLAELDGRIPLVLDAGPTAVGLESTVVRVTADGELELLRPGGVTRESLLAVATIKSAEPSDAADRQSPGRRAVHYAPDKPVVSCGVAEDPAPLLRALAPAPTRVGVLRFLRADRGDGDALPAPWSAALATVTVDVEALADPGDGTAAAAGLFAALRTLDAGPCEALLVERPDDATGLWAAIADRLFRAAARG